jgi:hypothetical protein
MKRLIAIILFKLGRFKNSSYYDLEKWGIEDIYEGKIIWL